jgi:hypothetical protein
MTGETDNDAGREIAPSGLGHLAMVAKEAAEGSTPELTPTADSVGATGPAGEHPPEADAAIDVGHERPNSIGWD